MYQVEKSGKVALGPMYGRVQVNGLTLEKAEAAARDHLKTVLRDPNASLTRYNPVTNTWATRLFIASFFLAAHCGLG